MLDAVQQEKSFLLLHQTPHNYSSKENNKQKYGWQDPASPLSVYSLCSHTYFYYLTYSETSD